MSNPHAPPPTRSTFFERLGVYMLGIALGLVLLGFFQAGRRRAAQRQQKQHIVQPAPEPVNESVEPGSQNGQPASRLE